MSMLSWCMYVCMRESVCVCVGSEGGRRRRQIYIYVRRREHLARAFIFAIVPSRTCIYAKQITLCVLFSIPLMAATRARPFSLSLSLFSMPSMEIYAHRHGTHFCSCSPPVSRERERKTHICAGNMMYTHTHTHTEREREREREKHFSSFMERTRRSASLTAIGAAIFLSYRSAAPPFLTPREFSSWCSLPPSHTHTHTRTPLPELTLLSFQSTRTHTHVTSFHVDQVWCVHPHHSLSLFQHASPLSLSPEPNALLLLLSSRLMGAARVSRCAQNPATRGGSDKPSFFRVFQHGFKSQQLLVEGKEKEEEEKEWRKEEEEELRFLRWF